MDSPRNADEHAATADPIAPDERIVTDGGRGDADGGRDGDTNGGRSGDTSGGQGGDANGGDASDGGDRSGGDEEPTIAETAVLVLSAVLTVAILAYAGWQIAAAPAVGVPSASVGETQALDGGSVAVTVRLENPRDTGLISATVESDCTAPPADVGLSYVPAATTRTATLVCPPGTTDPNVSVANWVDR